MSATRLTVLLVEDNPDDAEILREMLAETHASVHLHTVETLRDALGRLGRESFDVLLLDLYLPDSQGLATVERTLAYAPRTPILVLTGLEDEALGAAAVQAGAQDYLVKGQVDGRTLVRGMRYAIERHSLLAAQTEDAEIWATLAHAGEAMLAATGHGVLDRLCAVAATALRCDNAHVWILDRTGATFLRAAVRSQSADPPEAELRVSRETLQPLMSASARNGALCWLSPRLRRVLPPALVRLEAGITEVLYLILMHGSELIGVLACGYRLRPGQGEAVHRIARGLVHVAALALSNARLIDELEQSNAIKTHFAATMSHELRNTLFGLKGYSDILRGALGDGDAAEPMRLARLIGERSREGLTVIESALELTRSEVHQPDSRAGDVVVSELLQQLASETPVPDDKPDLRVDWFVPPSLPRLRTDAIKLRMVLGNLIGNAVKFTDTGSVRVAVEPVAGGVQFVVADTGIGINAAELPHLFEPFHQGHGERSRGAGGAGLGLYIVDRLVALLGGTVTVDSQPGVGTTFRVTLPVQTSTSD